MSRAVRAVLAFVAVAAVLAAPGCGGSGDSAGPADAGLGLDGRTFLSTSVEGRDLVEGTRVRLSFDAGRLSATAGCNSLGGTYSIEDGLLRVRQLAGTEMGCDQQLHDQDAWLAELLTSEPSITAPEPAKLRVAGSSTTLTLVDREVAEPDLPLLGTRWTVDTVIDGDIAASVPEGAEAWVRFSDGSIEGSDGVNRFSAAVHIGSHTITVTERTSTAVAAPDAHAARLVDAVAAATTGTVTYEIDGSRLRLLSAGGQGVGATASALL